MSRQRHIPSTGHGFFTFDDRKPQGPAVNRSSGQGHRQAQQLPEQDTPKTITPVGDKPAPVRAQETLGQVAHSEDDLSEKEQDKLLDLEHEALKADILVDRLQRKLTEAQADAQQKHLKVDEFRQRIERARQQSHFQGTSSILQSAQSQGATVGVTQMNQVEQLPRTTNSTGHGVSTFVPHPTIPVNGKRDRAERDNVDIDSNEETRRVRQRTNPAPTEASQQAVAYPSKSSQGKGGPVSRRHEHPSTQMKPSGPLSRSGPQNLSSHTQCLYQTSISAVYPQQASYVAHRPHNDQVQASKRGTLANDAEGAGKVEPEFPQQWATSPYQTDAKTGIAPEDSFGTPDWEENNRKPTVKRQTKRQKLLASGKNIPKDSEKEKGKTALDNNGNLFVELNGKLEPAAYHHERRHGLLAREAQKGHYCK
ncbi:MAG: hypothetical protein Q9223_005403 [Gallowayella weberi]